MEGGIRWGRSMVWERGSAAAMARWRERRRRRCHRLGEGGRKGRGGGHGLLGCSSQKGRMGRLATGPIGLKVEEKFFSDKNRIFEYTKALEICATRFRRNLDKRIFPQFF
jgi:hypothetical protein